MRGSITHHPVTKETEDLVRQAIRRCQDRIRAYTREQNEEIFRLQKLLTDAGFSI